MDNVTLLLTTYNNQERIKYTLNSIKNQTYKNFQLLIVDDASSDNTVNIIKEYYNIFNDMKIIEKSNNYGLADSLNIGINESKYDLIIRHDSEDISHKDRIGILLNEYSKNPKVSCISTSCFLLHGNYEFIGYVPVFGIRFVNLLLDFNINRIFHASVLYNKKHVLEVGGYPDLRASQDYALWKKMREHKMLFKFINKPIYSFFRENKGISAANKNDLQLLNHFKTSGKNISLEKIRIIQKKQVIKNHIVFNVPLDEPYNSDMRYIYYSTQRIKNKINMVKYGNYIGGYRIM